MEFIYIPKFYFKPVKKQQKQWWGPTTKNPEQDDMFQNFDKLKCI